MAKTIATSNYVSVFNGVVNSVFMGSDLPEYNPNDITVIDVSNLSVKPQLGWTYNYANQSFYAPTEPTLTIDQARAIKNEEIKAARGAYLLPSGINYMSTVFDLNQETYLNLTATAASVSLLGALPSNFGWIDQNNNFVPMTLDQFKGFVALVATIFHDGFAISAVKKTQLNAATTLAEIAAITV